MEDILPTNPAQNGAATFTGSARAATISKERQGDGGEEGHERRVESEDEEEQAQLRAALIERVHQHLVDDAHVVAKAREDPTGRCAHPIL